MANLEFITISVNFVILLIYLTFFHLLSLKSTKYSIAKYLPYSSNIPTKDLPLFEFLTVMPPYCPPILFNANSKSPLSRILNKEIPFE